MPRQIVGDRRSRQTTTIVRLDLGERFTEPEPNVIESTAGFSIRVLGRTGLRYSEGDRTAWIDSEVLAAPRSIAIAMMSMKAWDSPSGPEQVTEADRDRVQRNIERAFVGCGYVPRFHPDSETTDVANWLFRDRPTHPG